MSKKPKKPKATMTGPQFKHMRELLGFKKREHIAEHMGVTYGCVAKWESGERPVPLYAIKSLRRIWASA